MKKSQNGIASVILISVLVAVVAGVGFFAFQRIQPNNKATESSQPINSSNDTNAITYSTIAEWGVKVPQKPDGNELSYQMLNETTASFVSSEQKALGGSCGQFNFARYVLYRVRNGQEPTEVFVTSRMDAAVKAGNFQKIDDYTYYVFADFSGGVCDNTPPGGSMSEKEKGANNNLLNALKEVTKA